MRRAALLVAGAFAIRLAFGLASELFGPDQSQIYLIGLQFFTTRAWPYFGPDVVYTHTRVPGALQGLLVGGPLFLAPVPEAPYVVLNALSLGALLAIGWYVGKRMPGIPTWILWPWILFAPWTLDMSTNINNPSYVLPGAVAFFIGAFETTPALRCGVVGRRTAWALMGFGFVWVFQLELSYALLVPIAVAVVIAAARESAGDAARGLASLAGGAAISGVTLAPTLHHFGFRAVLDSTAANVVFEPGRLLLIPEIVARFLSLASFEIARFIGSDTATRLQFLSDYPWAAPFVVAAALGGLIQIVVLAAGLFHTRHPRRDWLAVRVATIGVLVVTCATFTLSVKDPASHTIYPLLPLAMIYAFTCWAPWLHSRRVRRFAAALMVCGGVTHVALAVRNLHLRSLYTNRPVVVRAIEARDYRIMGERRPDAGK